VASIGESSNETSGPIKCGNFSSLVEEPLTSQAGLGSKDLFGNSNYKYCNLDRSLDCTGFKDYVLQRCVKKSIPLLLIKHT
jgi:hypothetical protein